MLCSGSRNFGGFIFSITLKKLPPVFKHKFVQKYWHLVDLDNSGSLSFDEYKYMMAGFAAVDAGLVLKVRFAIVPRYLHFDDF